MDALNVAATICISLVAGVVLALSLSSSSSYPADHKRPKEAIPSPRETLLPRLSPEEIARLPYPPDLLPGGRWITTPYGVQRVYEWGPETGRKVLLIHGDTSPAPVLARIAHNLAEKDCRVILFDLWGRGWSDTPVNIRHDVRLFAMQIFVAIQSSPLVWIGPKSGGFSLVGFSLSGAITMYFAAQFPTFVNSIVLHAPAGILRSLPPAYQSPCFKYRRYMPSKLLRNRLWKLLETKWSVAPSPGSTLILRDEPTSLDNLDVPAIVQWQFENHDGFAHAFMEAIDFGPSMHQQSHWSKLATMMSTPPEKTSSGKCSQLQGSKILVVFGENDGIVDKDVVKLDLERIFRGSEHLLFKTVAGGHGFPVPRANEVTDLISEFWGPQQPGSGCPAH